MVGSSVPGNVSVGSVTVVDSVSGSGYCGSNTVGVVGNTTGSEGPVEPPG